jgi:hypothetical protein
MFSLGNEENNYALLIKKFTQGQELVRIDDSPMCAHCCRNEITTTTIFIQFSPMPVLLFIHDCFIPCMYIFSTTMNSGMFTRKLNRAIKLNMHELSKFIAVKV